MAVLLLAAAAAPAARAALPDPSQNGADSAAELGIDLEAEYANLAPRLEGLGAIPALEEIEAFTYDMFSRHPGFEDARNIQGNTPEAQKQVEDAVTRFTWTGIRDGSSDYFRVYGVSSTVQRIRGELVRMALEREDLGLSQFETSLIYGASKVADAYDQYFVEWVKTMQSPETEALAEALQNPGPVPEELLNYYTVVQGTGPDDVWQEAYASYFAEPLAPVLQALNDWVGMLEWAAENSTSPLNEQAYIDWARQYRKCMGETDVDSLEACWREVDVLWMSITDWILPMHDQNYGYSDPFRSKVEPEFTLFLQDMGYAAEAKTMERVNELLQDFYRERNTTLSEAGIATLQKDLSGLYYVPFSAAGTLVFRGTALSQPNRADVKEEYGVKEIYDLPVAELREGVSKEYAFQVLADPALPDFCVDAMETIIYQMAPHELSHGIYPLSAMPDLTAETMVPMDEVRTDLNALQSLLLLLKEGDITQEQVGKYSCGWLLSELRRLLQLSSPGSEGYAQSGAMMWKIAGEVGLAKVDDDGNVALDLTKSEEWLEKHSELLMSIIEAQEAEDAAKMEQIWQDFQMAGRTSSLVTHLIEKLSEAFF